MRRWKVINDGITYFSIGEIITLYEDDMSRAPKFNSPRSSDGWAYCNTDRLVEIDENGNTIRTYKVGDKLNEGTLVEGTMDKKEAKKRLDAIEAETKALREILEKPEGIVYDKDKIYGAEGDHGTYLLLGRQGSYAFYKLISSEFSYSCTESSGQEAINYMIANGFTIHEFSNRDDALKFMMEEN